MANKRPTPPRPTACHFSCDLCYRRKVKCDRGNPCSYCVRQQVECQPSSVETSDRPRKRRFPEAELLRRIKRYEAALLSYGADPESIYNGENVSPDPLSNTTSSRRSAASPEYSMPGVASSKYTDPVSASPLSPDDMESRDELEDVLKIITVEDEQTSSNAFRESQTKLDGFFKSDGSTLLSAVDPSKVVAHPAPFDIFKLWQIYCDNVHPLCKVLHAPTFQRKISTYGSHLHMAPSADQALFFAVYLAAICSMRAEECEATFFSTKETLEEQYKLATQAWLGRAGLWHTTELSVLQAFVLFLSTQQNNVIPRALFLFTGMAERMARRMGLHHDVTAQSTSLVEQQVRRRVWWELILLDDRMVEKAGMVSMSLTGPWNTSLPSARSDADLECLQGDPHSGNRPPSSTMVFLLVRSEAARLVSDMRNRAVKLSLDQKLQAIEELEARLRSNYLCFCDEALPQHRLTLSFSSILVARMRLSAYLIEEAAGDELKRPAIRLRVLKQSTLIMEHFNRMRGDPDLGHFLWFLHHYMPIFAYIHLLRVLQMVATGQLVDRAWQAVEEFKRHGARVPLDSLILRAWKARERATGSTIEAPECVKAILRARAGEADAQQTAKGAWNMSMGASAEPSNSDYMTMLADIMTGSSDYAFDWSAWLNESPSQSN